MILKWPLIMIYWRNGETMKHEFAARTHCIPHGHIILYTVTT